MDESGPASRTRTKSTKKENPKSQVSVTYCELSESEIYKEDDPYLCQVTPKVSNKQKEKSRTPSGQIVSTSVKDIRNFFQQDSSKKSEKSAHDRKLKRNSQRINKSANSQPALKEINQPLIKDPLDIKERQKMRIQTEAKTAQEETGTAESNSELRKPHRGRSKLNQNGH